MSNNELRRLRWFDQGVEAFEKAFPGCLRPACGPRYFCPICDQPFSRETALDSFPDERRRLTEEHVPPEGLGGKGLFLTCKQCNNDAGSLLDAHAIHEGRTESIRRGKPMSSEKMVFESNGVILNGQVVATTGGMEVKIADGRNDPRSMTAFRSKFHRIGDTITAKEIGRRFDERMANLSWLRAGFLAAFATHGYRYSCNPAVSIVKSQIRDPQSQFLTHFLCWRTPDENGPTWRVCEVSDLECFAVVFRSRIVLLPCPDDLTFYQRYAGLVQAEDPRSAPTSMRLLSWAGDDLLFGFPLAELNADLSRS